MIKYIVIVMIFLSHSVLGQISFGGLNTAMGVMGGLQNVGGYRSPQSYFPNQYQRPNMGYQQPNMGTGLGSVPLANNTPLYTRNFTLNNGYLFGQSKFYYYDPKSK